jgi:selenocysteine lyase/cysteine desulfurase
MKTEKIKKREQELLDLAWKELRKVKRLKILAENVKQRLGVISFYMEGIHHNLVTRLLNDLYGIQVRGGCSCAGTYGHFLLNVDFEKSHEITSHIDHGDLSLKPGWIRLSIHPTMTEKELYTVINALNDISENIDKYKPEYKLVRTTNEFVHKTNPVTYDALLNAWFNLKSENYVFSGE